MNLICKNDKYGEKNKEYQVFIGDNDIYVSDDEGVIVMYNFPRREIAIHRNFVNTGLWDKKHNLFVDRRRKEKN